MLQDWEIDGKLSRPSPGIEAYWSASHLKDLGDHARRLKHASSELHFCLSLHIQLRLTLPYARSFHAGRALATLGASIDLLLTPSTWYF